MFQQLLWFTIQDFAVTYSAVKLYTFDFHEVELAHCFYSSAVPKENLQDCAYA